MSSADKVLDRIRKLLRLAESANVHEAANAAARAQALMERHRIDTAALEEDEPFADLADDPLEVGGRLPRWRTSLAAAVARLGGCRVYASQRGRDRTLVLVGRPGDAAGVRILYVHLCREIDRLTRALGHGRGRRWCSGFRLGAVTTVVERLQQARRDAREHAREEARQRVLAGRGEALILFEQGLTRLEALDAALHDWIRRNLELKQARRRTVRARADAYAQGRAAGHRVSLGGTHRALAPAK